MIKIMKVFALEAQEWKVAERNGLSKSVCKEVVNETLEKSKKLMPLLSPYVNVLLRAHSEKAVPEIAVGGETYDSELILLSFDESAPHGKKSLLEQLKATTYHEANHAARFAWIAKAKIYEQTLITGAIWEGLATVCERDYGKTQPEWGKYNDDESMLKWFQELISADERKEQWSKWAFKREDGRHWLAYKVGTWIIDKVIENTDHTVSELTGMPSGKILKLAGL